MNGKRPVLLVGGGTGGHIYPLVALGEELSSQGQPFIFVGGKNGKEREIVQELGWSYQGIDAGKWRRYLTLKSITENIADIFRFIKGFFQSARLISKNGVQTVFSKGGYVALPVVLAAWVLGCRVIIHESDSVMGLTNRISARFAKLVLTAFDPTVFPNRDKRFMQVGFPIRRMLRKAATLSPPKKSRPLILVIGGSQGSEAINSFVRASLPKLIGVADIVHITGEGEAMLHKKLSERLERKNKNAYKPFAFVNRELPYYYQLCDLIVSRAGATTLAEAALFGRALYLVPLPNAAGNHQLINAKLLQASGAATYRLQSDLTPEQFAADITQLLADKNQLQQLGRRLKEYFHAAEGTSQIAAIIQGKENG